MKAIPPLLLLLVGGALAVVFWRARGPAESGAAPQPPQQVVLGPVDGHDLPSTEIERVALGTEAPDFSLLAYSDDVLTLSDYRGAKDIILVFYRGHW